MLIWSLSSRSIIANVASLVSSAPETNAKSQLLKEPEGDKHWGESVGIHPSSSSAFGSVSLQLEKKWPLPEALTSQRSGVLLVVDKDQRQALR